MKVSEFINLLQSHMNKNGDSEIIIREDYGYCSPVLVEWYKEDRYDDIPTAQIIGDLFNISQIPKEHNTFRKD